MSGHSRAVVVRNGGDSYSLSPLFKHSYNNLYLRRLVGEVRGGGAVDCGKIGEPKKGLGGTQGGGAAEPTPRHRLMPTRLAEYRGTCCCLEGAIQRPDLQGAQRGAAEQPAGPVHRASARRPGSGEEASLWSNISLVLYVRNFAMVHVCGHCCYAAVLYTFG